METRHLARNALSQRLQPHCAHLLCKCLEIEFAIFVLFPIDQILYRASYTVLFSLKTITFPTTANTKSIIMRDRDKDCKLLLLPKSTESKEKRAKKKEKKKQTNTSKKRGHSSTPQNSDDTEKNQPPVSKAPLATPTRPPLPVESTDQSVKVKGRLRHGEGARRRTRLPKEEKTQSGMSLVTGAPSPAPVLEVSAQVQESLRWEGVLEDPLEEEKRLEVYKANRRQRYLIHRQALIAADKTPGLNQDSNRDKEDHKVMTLQD